MHTGQKYALNLRHVYAHRAEVCPESEARFYPLCISMNWIQGKVLPPGDGLPEISGIKKRVRNGSAFAIANGCVHSIKDDELLAVQSSGMGKWAICWPFLSNTVTPSPVR